MENLKEELKNLIKEFKKECEYRGNARYPQKDIEPNFKNFIYWLEESTWDME